MMLQTPAEFIISMIRWPSTFLYQFKERKTSKREKREARIGQERQAQTHKTDGTREQDGGQDERGKREPQTKREWSESGCGKPDVIIEMILFEMMKSSLGFFFPFFYR